MKVFNALFTGLVLFFLASCSGPSTENKVEATDPAAAETATDATTTTYSLQKDFSVIKWKGSNKFTPKAHEGTLQFSDGSFSVVNNQPTGGNFVADMNTINTAGDEYTEGEKKVGFLVGHLKSADFFDAATFPNATFAITSLKKLENNLQYSHEIAGNLTIKGITKQIAFPAKVEISGADLKGTAAFTIDRSQWEVKYGSESFFPDLMKDKLIRNEIELTLDIVAKAQ